MPGFGTSPERAAERIDGSVGRLGLTRTPPPAGRDLQRRRAAPARDRPGARLGPRVLFLDEPTVGLDPRIRAELLDVIAGLRDRAETTILLTTHYLDEAERLCDRLAIMHEGTIVALDSPSKLRPELGDEIVELRVRGSGEIALDALRAGGLAGDDAFAIGATVTVPLHGRRGADTVRAIESLGLAQSPSPRARPPSTTSTSGSPAASSAKPREPDERSTRHEHRNHGARPPAAARRPAVARRRSPRWPAAGSASRRGRPASSSSRC